jgi:hypothetical protein
MHRLACVRSLACRCCPAVGVPALWCVSGDAPGAWAPGTAAVAPAAGSGHCRDPDSTLAEKACRDPLPLHASSKGCARMHGCSCKQGWFDPRSCVYKGTWADREAWKVWGPENYTVAVWCKPVNTGRSLLQFLRASAQAQPATAALRHCTVIQWTPRESRGWAHY